MVGTPQRGRIQNMTIPITFVILAQLAGETSCRMLDPNRLAVSSTRNGDLDENVLSLMGDEEEEERLSFGSLLTGGEGGVGENEKDNFKKVEGEEIQEFEGDLFVL